MCAQNINGYGIGCQAIHRPYIIYMCEAIQISPPNLSDRGLLNSPITVNMFRTTFF